MPEKDKNILKYNHGKKSSKKGCKKISLELKLKLELKFRLKNRQELKQINIQLVVIHYLRIVHWIPQKKHDHYRGKDCMKSFCKDLKEHATKMINYENNTMIPFK